MLQTIFHRKTSFGYHQSTLLHHIGIQYGFSETYYIAFDKNAGLLEQHLLEQLSIFYILSVLAVSSG